MKCSKGVVDRLEFAREMCRGRRVLDIGGHKYTDVNHTSMHKLAMNVGGGSMPPFIRAYSQIQEVAQDYRIVDIQPSALTDYVMDLNQLQSIPQLRQVIDDYRPEVILCMETLEHVACHYEVMNEIARAVKNVNAKAYITLPNNENWILDALGWNNDHIIAFFRKIAWRFVTRSELGDCRIEMHGCMQKYLWYWRLVYILSFFQPLSWGFVIEPAKSEAAQ